MTKLLGVLPETQNKSTGSVPRVSIGRNISRLYIRSRSLPVYNFGLFGSTPKSTIPLLWECYRESGTAPGLFNSTCTILYHVYNFGLFGSTPESTIPLVLEHSHKSGIVLPGVLPDMP